MEIVEIVLVLKQRRNLLLKIMGVALALGVSISLLLPIEYKSKGAFYPSIDNPSKIPGNLGGLAAIAGINLSGINESKGVSPLLYPKLVESNRFKWELANKPIYFSSIGETMSYFEFYNLYGKNNWLKRLGFGSTSSVEAIKFDSTDYLTLNKAQYDFLEEFGDRIECNVYLEDGYVTVSAIMPDPVAAADLTLHLKELLQDYVLEKQILKANQELTFIQERYDEMEREFREVQKRYFSFQDRNMNLNTASSRLELEIIQDEYEILKSIVQELSSQLESQKLMVQKDTPVFSEIERPSNPKLKYSPKRSIIVLLFGFLGLLYFLIHLWFLSLKDEISKI
ncbi:MAG: hypothetical protein VYB44_18350 [Bacteroidota bacterium]|nr:hypothetical protein [Bacteroidota bacterium]